MKAATELAQKPAEFLRTTGVSYATFVIILEKVEECVEQFKEQNPLHRRGRKGSLSLSQTLLLTLMYLRQYHTFLSLGQAFSVSESYAHKRYCYMRGVLVQVLDMPAGLLAPAGPLKVAVDVSEQPVERPLKGQRGYYSGKKKAHGQGPDRRLPAHGADSGRLLRQGPPARLPALEAEQVAPPPRDGPLRRPGLPGRRPAPPKVGAALQGQQKAPAHQRAEKAQQGAGGHPGAGGAREPAVQDLPHRQGHLPGQAQELRPELESGGGHQQLENSLPPLK